MRDGLSTIPCKVGLKALQLQVFRLLPHPTRSLWAETRGGGRQGRANH